MKANIDRHTQEISDLLARIRELEEGIRTLIGFIPDGWEVPLGYVNIVSQVRKLLEDKDANDNP